jgi:hypothetical protein
MLGEHVLEATSGRVQGTLAHRDELWDQSYQSLIENTEERFVQEVARLGGHYAHVLDESIDSRRDDAAGEAWLHGRFTYMLYRRATPDARRGAAGLGLAVALVAGMALIPSMDVRAQKQHPPLETPEAVEASMKHFYRAANVIIVTTIDGMEHVYHFTKDLVVHGGKKPGVDALEGLREGTMIVVHRNVSGPETSVAEIDLVGDEGLKITEGVVTDINRRKQEITITYTNGTTETLKMTAQAAAENDTLGRPVSTRMRIVIYYADEAGRKVAHYVRGS